MNATDQKRLLGKILGEIYRLQKHSGTTTCVVGDAVIYGLLNGFEYVIDSELESMGFVSNKDLQSVIDVLEPIWINPEKLAKFKGFYDIEKELRSKGVDRGKAIPILTFLKANGQFTEIIEKMDSTDSPTECRSFEITDWDV